MNFKSQPNVPMSGPNRKLNLSVDGIIRDLEPRKTLFTLSCGHTSVLTEYPTYQEVQESELVKQFLKHKNQSWHLTDNQIIGHLARNSGRTKEEVKKIVEKYFNDKYNYKP